MRQPATRGRRRAKAERLAPAGDLSQAATVRRQRAFLAAFVNNGAVVHAARAARVSRSVVYHWRRTDESFERRFQEALEDAAEVIEAEARRRAVDGWQEEVYQQGRLVGTVTRYSNTLLALLLRCRRPEIYGNRAAAKTPSTPTVPLIDPKMSTDAELIERITAAQTLLVGRIG
jgi:hypothetical protein